MTLPEGTGDCSKESTRGPAVRAHADDVDFDVIEGVVSELRQLSQAAAMTYALNVGRLVIDRFFGGDLSAWRARGRKDMSLRRLAHHPDLPMSAAGLYRYLSVYELCQSLGGVVRWEHLGVSHLRAVLPLDREEQLRLLEAAETKRWAVSRLEAEVARTRRINVGKSGGRRPRPLLTKSIGLLCRCIERNFELFREPDAVSQLDAQSARDLHAAVSRIKVALVNLEQQLASVNSTFIQ